MFCTVLFKQVCFPFYTNLQLLLCLANLQHKCLGLDLQLGQVSLNSVNVQKLTVLHGFIKTSLFPFYTNLQLSLHLANLPHKCLDLDQRLGHVSSNSENVQNLSVLHGLVKQVCFPFILTCSYYYSQQIYNTMHWSRPTFGSSFVQFRVRL